MKEKFHTSEHGLHGMLWDSGTTFSHQFLLRDLDIKQPFFLVKVYNSTLDLGN